MRKKVKIITLGCSKNTVDSEKLMHQLGASGYEIDLDAETTKTDIVIVNTCGFINDAKEESINTILELVAARERGDIGSLYVMGCLSERYRKELEKEIPEVDKYFGVNKPEEILQFLSGSYSKTLKPDRILTGPDHYAYLKVSEGCNRNCSFCAIPGIRGRYKSNSIDELAKEAEILTGKGVKEIILIAQDLTYYGIDHHKRPMLTPLINRLTETDKLEWLRLHYLYPGSIPQDLLQVMKSNSAICNYIDIPIQHISERMLRAMSRGHSGYDTRRILADIRNYFPEAAVRTTLIAGYPGETDSDFQELYDFVSDYRFDRLGVFSYSHEEGTPAYISSHDTVPEKIKRERLDALMSLQQEISYQKNTDLIGSKLSVIIDREEGPYTIARSEYDSPEIDQEILIRSDISNPLVPGNFYDVLITGATEFDLEAIPV